MGVVVGQRNTSHKNRLMARVAGTTAPQPRRGGVFYASNSSRTASAVRGKKTRRCQQTRIRWCAHANTGAVRRTSTNPEPRVVVWGGSRRGECWVAEGGGGASAVAWCGV